MRKYTAEQKANALAMALRIGAKPAAKELGIPQSTLGDWVKASRATPSQSSESATRTEVEAEAGRRRVARKYTPSQRAQALEMVGKEGIAETSRRLGMSRFSLHEWQRMHRRAVEQGTVQSPLAGSDEDQIATRDNRILSEWKKQPGLGPSQIRNQLRRAGFKVSVRTVRMVMQEHGYMPPKIKREAHDQRYEAIRPNQLWHMDFLQRHVHQQKVSVLFVVDDYSRYIPGFALWDEDRAAAVFECFESCVSRHGKPEAVMSDGGAAFWSWRGISQFTRLLEEMGIDQVIAKVPQVNGKLEVLNANVQKELFNQDKFFDLGQAMVRVRAWVSFYNFRRTHHALGGLLVPADRYFGRADQVLAQIEMGSTADGVGEPSEVADRQLDLLRVTSHAGKIQVCLMGERIWPQSSA